MRVSSHLTALIEQAGGVGLQMNMDKTKYIIVATTQGDVSVPGLGSLQQVDDFKYLGSMMISSQADIVVRGGQAWGAFWNMNAIWCLMELPMHIRVRIFHSNCLSILLYGSESWSLNKAMTSRLDSLQEVVIATCSASREQTAFGMR